ncbi:hypothetical protein HY285_05790 [Candidatus Peregrinibacteria bacterium]|nr:hypothetical protein [Candidatus Peregrinibacteria bacterium]MBI3817019.1 hypothetical protein [Candidatus Peregrinibacteria bacterium]
MSSGTAKRDATAADWQRLDPRVRVRRPQPPDATASAVSSPHTSTKAPTHP